MISVKIWVSGTYKLKHVPFSQIHNKHPQNKTLINKNQNLIKHQANKMNSLNENKSTQVLNKIHSPLT